MAKSQQTIVSVKTVNYFHILFAQFEIENVNVTCYATFVRRLWNDDSSILVLKCIIEEAKRIPTFYFFLPYSEAQSDSVICYVLQQFLLPLDHSMPNY